MRLPVFHLPDDVERLAPLTFRFPLWEPKDCEDFIEALESMPDDWITPDRAEELAARPEVAGSFPDGFDLVGLIKRRRIREFPLYSIPGFRESWEEYCQPLMRYLETLWGCELQEVIPPFVFCYSKQPGLKSKLEEHVDSYNTFVLPLSDEASYVGGGTYIPEYDLTIHDVQGCPHVFPGHSFYAPPSAGGTADIFDEVVELHPQLIHATHRVTRGSRYVLVAFFR